MPTIFSDKFVCDYIDDSKEGVHSYYLSNLHFVHLGDILDSSKYKVVHKLSYGTSSIVWLAWDYNLHRYIAVKIKKSDLSNLYNKFDIF